MKAFKPAETVTVSLGEIINKSQLQLRSDSSLPCRLKACSAGRPKVEWLLNLKKLEGTIDKLLLAEVGTQAARWKKSFSHTKSK